MGKRTNVIPFGFTDTSLSRRIAEVAADSSRVQVTFHAKQRMRQRRVMLTQVLEVLAHGRVVEHAHQNIQGHWQCTLERVVAGDRIKVAAALTQDGDDFVVVITVMN